MTLSTQTIDGETFFRADVDDHSFRVRSTQKGGAGDRPTFVLIHGIGMSDLSLLTLHRALAPTGDVYTLVLPGYGANRAPKEAPTIAEFAVLCHRLLEQLGVTDYVVIGQSMGCQVAIELALLPGSRATGVVLIAPVCEPGRRTSVQQALSLTRDSVKEPFSANVIVVVDYLRCGIRWYLKSMPTMLDYRAEERVPQLSVPLLVVRGSEDPIAKDPWCESLAAAARDGRLAVVPGMRHHVQYSAPDAVAGHIIDALVRP